MQQLTKQQITAYAGMIGSALFIATFTIEGLLRPGYNPISMYISELSLGPRGWIQITNFITSGALLLVFTLGIHYEFREGKASKAGPALLAVLAACLMLSGPFVMDTASTPIEQMTTSGLMHQLLGAVVFLLAPIICFVFWRRFRIDPKWRALNWWTLIATVMIASAVIILRIASSPAFAASDLVSWIGLIQRVALVPYLVWVFTFALALYKQTKRGSV